MHLITLERLDEIFYPSNVCNEIDTSELQQLFMQEVNTHFKMYFETPDAAHRFYLSTDIDDNHFCILSDALYRQFKRFMVVSGWETEGDCVLLPAYKVFELSQHKDRLSKIVGLLTEMCATIDTIEVEDYLHETVKIDVDRYVELSILCEEKIAI